MEVVIKIPDQIYRKIKETSTVIMGRRNGKRIDYILFNAVNTGTPLPKGHGRIIDESQISSVEYHEEIENIGTLFERIHPIIDSTDAPTIIEADTGETE